MLNAENQQPIEACGICDHSLVLGQIEKEPSSRGTHRGLLSQGSRFSNIEELDAEQETESDLNENESYNGRDHTQSAKNSPAKISSKSLSS